MEKQEGPKTAVVRPEGPCIGRGEPAPAVSVIIPHFNDLENLEECLRLLTEQTFPANRFEIIVADNNSACGLIRVQGLCDVRAKVVPAFVQGAAAARNAGVKAARGQILAFIDSDCRPSPDWMESGIAALADADIVGGRVDVDVQDRGNLTPVEAFESVFAFNFKRYIEKEGFAGTGNMFVPRSIFSKVGEFRSNVSEDKDWGQRASAQGFRWKYAPNARVSHPARREWEELRSKWRKTIHETYRLANERPAGRLRWMLRSWMVLCSPVPHSWNVLCSPKLNRFRDRLKAIGVLFRIRWWRFLESHRILLENEEVND
jgi:glycosyltransferase involved in cell wall biosynthesis